MMMFLPTTKSILRIALLSVVLAFSLSHTFVTAFRSTGLFSSGTTVSPTKQRRRHQQLPTSSLTFFAKQPIVAFPSTSASSSASTTVLYRIRCENKYYQLEELEDADNCTTELFLKSNGVVDVLETDGPLFVKAVGEWNVSAEDFVMSITKTYTTGQEGNDMGEFTFDVERVFQGEMMVVGGTEVAVNGKIYAEDYLTTKIDKEVGFFNMIDGTNVRLDQRPDAADFTPGNNILGLATVDVGGPPTQINSNDVVQHGGIPPEWGLTATELQQRAATATVLPPDGAGAAATSSPYEDQLAQQYGQQQEQSPPVDAYGQQQQPQQQPLPNTIDAYEQQQQQQYQYQQQQQQQQPTNQGYTAGADTGAGGSGGLPEYGGGNFGQEAQAYGGGDDSNPSSYQQYGNDASGQGYDDQQQYQQQQYQQSSSNTSHNNNDPGPPSFTEYNTTPYGQEQQGQEEQQQPTAYNDGNGGTSYDSNNNNSDYDNTDPDDYYYNNGDDANANNTDDDNRPQGGNEYTPRRSGGLNPMGFGGNNDAY